MCNRRGFTLVEILFVVIIAAGVLAFAFPSLKKVQNHAHYQSALGMLLDLGNAVESITWDLKMQQINVSMNGSYNVASVLSEANQPNVTPADPTAQAPSLVDLVAGFGDGAGLDKRVIQLLVPLHYMKNFREDPHEDGKYEYYVSGASSGVCYPQDSFNGSGQLVACMVKSVQNPEDCFVGARYYKGGRVEAIRMSECHN